MKVWRYARARNILCWLLSSALIWPSVIFGVMGLSTPSAAQGIEFEKKPLVVVFDFDNRAGIEGSLLGRQATDAVWVEMQRSGIFEMIGRDQLDQEITLRDLKPPFDQAAMKMLSGALNATAYVYGTVTKAEVKESGGNTRAIVKMEVRIADRFSGELVNGALAEGEAVRPGYTGPPDLLVTEAVNKCAAQIVGEIKARKMPSGQVLMVSKDEVLLNVGAANGVKGDMEFVILRPRGQEFDVVGRCTATEMSNDDSHARVTQNLYGIRPEDRVRAIFRMDSDALTGMEKVEHEYNKGKKGVEKVLLPLLAVFAVYMLTKKSDSKRDEARELEGGAANENDNGRNGVNGVNGPTCVLKWRGPAGLTYTKILGYHVYRTPGGVLAKGSIPAGSLIVGSDDDLIWMDDSVVGDIFPYYVPESDITDDPNEVPDQEEGNDLGVTPGTHYRYGVTAIYQRMIPGGGDDGSNAYKWEESSMIYTPTITPLEMNPVGGVVVTPMSESSQDLKDIHFQWTAVRGADIYAIQVSDRLDFPANRTWEQTDMQRPVAPGTVIYLRVQNDSDLVRLAQVIGTDEVRLYWRVGARYSRDNPGPVGGYVWSNAVTFLAQPEPPPPPGG